VCSGGKQILTILKSSLELKLIEILSISTLGDFTTTTNISSTTISSSKVNQSTRRRHHRDDDDGGNGDNGDNNVENILITKQRQSNNEQIVVGCGYPGRGTNVIVVIVDTDSLKVLPDLSVGEIWISSPSKAIGYWGRSQHENDSEFQELSDDEAAILKSNSYFEDISFMGNTDSTKRKREDSDVCGSDTKIQIKTNWSKVFHPPTSAVN
jgi:acyl-CoA synthetase (AMP-forming)/AMP-acid ligase II